MADAFAPRPNTLAQYFERGMIAMLNGHAWAVYGSIYLHYRELGGPSGFLGLPVSDEMAGGSGRRSIFENGDILWSTGTGAHEIHGAIRNRYNAIGGASSGIGLPLSDETSILQDGREVGRYNAFSNNGGLYWSIATGAGEVYGAIAEKWQEFGGPLGSLGFPVSGETNTPDPGGRYNNFAHGIIVWRPSGAYAGAWPVFNLKVYLEQFESNFDPYHVQVNVTFTNPTAKFDNWFPSDSDYATTLAQRNHLG